MLPTFKRAITAKWLLVVQEYDLLKQQRSVNFTSVRQLCDTYKIHRKDIYKYYEKWIKSGKNTDALLPQKRGPKPGQLKILSKDQERLIVKIHRRLQANRYDIFYLIKGNPNLQIHPSVSTIYRTLKRYPLNKKRKRAIKRYERMYPGELLHADTYVLPKTLFIDRTKRYLLGVMDDMTRLCYAELIERNNAVTVTRAFANACKWFDGHGIRPETVMTDNGAEFTVPSYQKARPQHFFESMLQVLGLKHIYTPPYRPQSNGKIERFWKILDDECIRVQTATLSVDDFDAELNGYLYRYNYQRRHSGLGYITPLDKLSFIANLLPKL